MTMTNKYEWSVHWVPLIRLTNTEVESLIRTFKVRISKSVQMVNHASGVPVTVQVRILLSFITDTEVDLLTRNLKVRIIVSQNG